MVTVASVAKRFTTAPVHCRRIMPINRKYNLEKLLGVIRENFPRKDQGQGLTLAHFRAQLEDLREHIAHGRAQLEHLRDTSTG